MSTAWPLGVSDPADIRWLGHDIHVNPLVVAPLRLVEIRALRSEYGQAYAAGKIGATPTGFYVYRNRRPYPETPVTWAWHSEHAHGTCGDIDYDSNPLRTDGVLVTNFDRFGLDDGSDWLAAWLEPPEGLPVFFRWGGGWTTDHAQACVNLRHNGERIRTGVVDGMHFELALTPAEVRAFDWQAEIDREEAMDKRLQDAANFVEMLREELEPGKADATVGGAAKRVANTVLKVEQGLKP